MKRYVLFFLILISPATMFAQQQPPQPPAPDLSLSANAGSSNLYAGWPLILNLTVMNSTGLDPNATPAPLVVSPVGVPWPNAISISVASSTGSPVQWPLNLIGTPSDPVLTLAPADYVRMTWQMSAADVSALVPGTYTITASMQVSNSNGWNGSVQSPPVTLTVGPEPTLTASQQAEKAFQIAEFSINTGDFVTAVNATQQLRLNQPDNANAAAVAAGVLNLAGYGALAFLQTSDALNTFYRTNPNPVEAPINLLSSYQQLVNTIATPDTTAPAPTSTSESSALLTYSPNAQTLALSAIVSTSPGSVDGGSVTFTIAGIAGSATSNPVTAGSASATFPVPGGTHAGSYPMQAAYIGTAAFAPSSDATAALSIAQVTPAIQWGNPSDITVGVALGPTQLNATANVPGTFTYLPPAGTVLPVGTAQRLSATFVPTDSIDYNSASASALINVNNVKVVPGDLNGDGVVNCADMAIVKNSFGKKTGQLGFDPRADVNHDGVVNILDLSTVSRLLPAGTVCP